MAILPGGNPDDVLTATLGVGVAQLPGVTFNVEAYSAAFSW